MPSIDLAAQLPLMRQQLAAGLLDMGLTVDDAEQNLLIDFLCVLNKWGQTINLTAIMDGAQMVSRHLLDSLSVTPYLVGRQILDVGTGAGLPGIPLAVVCPDRHFTLLDSRSKRTRFVTQAVIELGLKNVTVVTGRIEDYNPGHDFDTVISRAFSSVAEFLDYARRLLRPGGQLLSMKGGLSGEALEQIGKEKYNDIKIKELFVSGLGAKRHLVCITL